MRTYSSVYFRCFTNAALCYPFILAVATLLTMPSMVKASVLVTSEETLMQAQLNEAAALDYFVAPDASSILQYNYAVDTSGGGFSYSTLPGQTYDGLSYSVSCAGTYNSSTNTYDWTATGQLGSSSWTEQGESQWTGDPTATITGTVTLGGIVTGTVTGTVEVDGMGHSSGTVTYTPTGGNPMQCSITDYVPSSGDWLLTWKGNSAYVPIQGKWVSNTGGGDTVTGLSSIYQSYTNVPEPSTIVLLGMGAISTLVYAWRRRWENGVI